MTYNILLNAMIVNGQRRSLVFIEYYTTQSNEI